MGKAVSPVTTGVVIAIVVVLLAIFGWKMLAPKTYTGPPIDMGAAMRGGGGGTSGGGTGR